jgi:hypothetical protein
MKDLMNDRIGLVVYTSESQYKSLATIVVILEAIKSIKQICFTRRNRGIGMG